MVLLGTRNMGGSGAPGSTPRKRTLGNGTGRSPGSDSGDEGWPQTLPDTSPRLGCGAQDGDHRGPAPGEKKPVQRSLAEGFGGPRHPKSGCKAEQVKVEMPGCEKRLMGKEERSAAGASPGKGGARCALRGCCHLLLETSPVPRLALLVAPLLAVVIIITLGLRSGQERRADHIETVCRPTVPCPDHWMWFGGKCYLFSKETRTWDASRDHCSSHNATLSIIDTQQEKTVITRFKDTKDYWVGLRKSGKEWIWVDGSPFRTGIIELKNDRHGLDCAYVNAGNLGALDCTSSRHWICTRDAAGFSAR